VRPYLENNPITKERAGGVAQGISPEFKPQCCKKKKKKKSKTKKPHKNKILNFDEVQFTYFFFLLLCFWCYV
jgi:hypothetical protein